MRRSTPGLLDPRTPVLVGIGTASGDVEAVELMALATEAALTDSGGRGLASGIDRVAVPQGSWAYPDPARLVADRIGAREAETRLVELGIPQQSLINGDCSGPLITRSTTCNDDERIVGNSGRRLSSQW